ncbi:transposase [Bacillus cereus]
MKSKYSEEFKQKCVSLVNEKGQSIYRVTKDLGLGHGTLNEWVRKATSEIPPLNPNTLKKNSSLQEDIQLLKQENEFLKKVAAFCLQHKN